MAERELWTVPLGRMPYAEALDLQRHIARDRITGALAQDVLLLVEHPPVVTLGRASKEKHLIASPAFLESKGVELFKRERVLLDLSRVTTLLVGLRVKNGRSPKITLLQVMIELASLMPKVLLTTVL